MEETHASDSAYEAVRSDGAAQMKRLGWFALALVLVVTPLMCWQHGRYQDFRRARAHDRQSSFYAGDAFHVLWLLELAPGQALEPSLRGFVGAVEAASGTPIYAGRAAGSTIVSNEFDTSAWDAVLLAQFPSRETYDAAWLEPARAVFQRSYAQGFVRPVALNLVLPQMLLGVRLFDLVTLQPSIFPVVPDPDIDMKAPKNPRFAEIFGALGDDAQRGLVFVNLVQAGTPEQEAGASGVHPRKMARAMAEGGYGPLHVGEAVTLEGDAEFERVMINYYPGTEFFLSLMSSTFIQETLRGYQPSGMEAVPTVPILDRL